MIHQLYLLKSVPILSLFLFNLSLLTCHFYSKTLLLLTCHLYRKTLSLLLLSTLFISKSLISTNQATKLVYQFILLTNAFLNLVVNYKKKTHACHAIKRAIGKTVKEWLVKLHYILVLKCQCQLFYCFLLEADLLIIVYNLDIVDKSRLVARWFSNLWQQKNPKK